MKSIRTKITLLTIFAIVISLFAATVFGIITIRRLGKENSEQMLLLLCEVGEKNLDSYFESVESSVETVSKYTQEDLDKGGVSDLEAHMDRVSSVFEKVSINTNGILTYYYRVDPSVTSSVNGFWYVKTSEMGFVKHDVTDISQYDTNDTTQIPWYTVPKATKKAVWLPPYVTENLGARVFSYNVPVFYNDDFFGVIGIEIEYSTVAEQVNNIKLFDNGYAFINDSEGNIIYHPLIDVTKLTEENKPKVPAGLLNDNNFVVYKYEGVKREAVWLSLSNGMRLNVSVPVSEISGNWKQLLFTMVGALSILLVVFVLVSLKITGPITKPITELSEGAKKVNNGDYDVKLNYKSNDEIGVLTNTFNNLISHLKDYIAELSSLAFDDALTSVHNKGAFDTNVHELQDLINSQKDDLEFAIAIFDCDNLKTINDRYGHKNGDIYLKTASNYICSIFRNSSVFRIGGDEFAVVMRNEDYANREELLKSFIRGMREINTLAQNKWNEVHLSVGLAAFEKERDLLVDDVINRADKLMYEYKRNNKIW